MGNKRNVKISGVKRSNHLKQKLRSRKLNKKNKQGNVNRKMVQITKKVPTETTQENEEQEEDLTEDMLSMIDHDDLQFLFQSVTHQSYEMFKNIRWPTPLEKVKQKRKNDNDKLETEYEMGLNQKRTKFLLPIKTKDGVVSQTTEVDLLEEEEKNIQHYLTEKKKEEERKMKKEAKKRKNKETDENVDNEDIFLMNQEKEEDIDFKILEESRPKEVSTVDLIACREELLQKRKFQIGHLAAGLLESPETKIGNFKYLLDILNNEKSQIKLTVRKLVVISLLEVFKDLLPSYQIKHQEFYDGVKLKKTTRALVNYEKSLLKAYKTFLKSLERFSNVLRPKRGSTRILSPTEISLGVVAVHCLSELLICHPYFNFSANIAQALVLFLDCNNASAQEIVLKALSRILKDDKKGELSLRIVRSVNYLVKKRNNSVHPEVLSVLLALRIRDVNLDAEKEAEIKEKKFMNRKQKLLAMSKRERRRSKQLDELEREMLETKAEENKVSKQKYLTEVTKIIFTIIFRILKQAPSSRLLSVTLECLAKFAHCINLEFFQDLVNVLSNLFAVKDLGHLEQLHCVETVFTILSGQGEALNIDPLRFYTHLYQALLAVHAGQSSNNAVVALRALEKAVIARRRKISQQRLLAFIKRLSSLALHLLHGGALGYLGVIRNIMTQSRSCDILIDTDTSLRNGIYQPELPEPEYCGAGATVLWELPLLARHYHPEVQKMAQIIMHDNKTSTLSPELAKLSPSQLAEFFDCSQMAFKPPVPVPGKALPRAHRGRLVLTNDDFALYLQSVEQSVKSQI